MGNLLTPMQFTKKGTNYLYIYDPHEVTDCSSLWILDLETAKWNKASSDHNRIHCTSTSHTISFHRGHETISICFKSWTETGTHLLFVLISFSKKNRFPTAPSLISYTETILADWYTLKTEIRYWLLMANTSASTNQNKRRCAN